MTGSPGVFAGSAWYFSAASACYSSAIFSWGLVARATLYEPKVFTNETLCLIEGISSLPESSEMKVAHHNPIEIQQSVF